MIQMGSIGASILLGKISILFSEIGKIFHPNAIVINNITKRYNTFVKSPMAQRINWRVGFALERVLLEKQSYRVMFWRIR
jgi:hypothetical protein